MLFASNLSELGALFRSERKASGKTQLAVARSAGLRRETIVRIEAGENIDMITFLKAASAIGKGIRLTDRRPDYDTVKGVFDED